MQQLLDIAPATQAPLLEVLVMGKAEPQGSAKAFVPVHPKTKQPYRRPDGSIMVNVTSDNPALKAWRETVSVAALEARQASGLAMIETGVLVEVVAFLKRPEGHYGTGRNAGSVKASAPPRPVVRPDADKLLRAVLDALTDVVWRDDSLVTDAVTRKRYAEHPGAERIEITVWAD